MGIKTANEIYVEHNDAVKNGEIPSYQSMSLNYKHAQLQRLENIEKLLAEDKHGEIIGKILVRHERLLETHEQLNELTKDIK